MPAPADHLDAIRTLAAEMAHCMVPHATQPVTVPELERIVAHAEALHVQIGHLEAAVAAYRGSVTSALGASEPVLAIVSAAERHLPATLRARVHDRVENQRHTRSA